MASDGERQIGLDRVNSSSLRRRVLAAVGGVALACAVSLIVLVAIWRDPTPELTPEALEAARDRWERHGPTSYDLELAIAGNRPGTVRLEVRDGVATSFTRDGHTPAQRRTWDYWTVDGQFDTLERELENAGDPQQTYRTDAGARVMLKAQFDEHYGYPRKFVRSVPGGQQDMQWEVQRFEMRERQ